MNASDLRTPLRMLVGSSDSPRTDINSKSYPSRGMWAAQIFAAFFLTGLLGASADLHAQSHDETAPLTWTSVPDLPDSLGVAGPFVGTHDGALLVAGGANFPQPVWDNAKVWHTSIYAMTKNESGYQWIEAGELPAPRGYGMSVSLPDGVLCLGGNDSQANYAECYWLQFSRANGRVTVVPTIPLPSPLAYGDACLLGDRVYVAGGQTDAGLESATAELWSIAVADLKLGNSRGNGSADSVSAKGWESHGKWPGQPRAFNMLVAQNNGFEECLYLMGGRYERDGKPQFLDDCWQYIPRTGQWREKASLPQAITAGTAIKYGQSGVLVLSGDDGALFDQTDALRDDHPGFRKVTYGYHTVTDAWTSMGSSPANQVTTKAVAFDEAIFLPTGEIRPRVRSPAVWKISVADSQGSFGIVDYLVLTVYLSALVAIGFYFARRTVGTDDYFRAAGKIPWWAAGCSIFATMLSSLTFTGVPSKAFAQDWVYAVGNFMIPVVAVLAVFVALPFYRYIDAASAYEYLHRRFGPEIRYFASACFSTFHVFRMAIVMSLTGLALAVATSMSPVQAVLLMGALSILYCSMGGVSAVIWTDTLQTVVLMGGALLAIAWMIGGTGETIGDLWSTATANDKLRLANWHWDPTISQLAFWVVVLGAIGQNTSSYTADQAVVQRYMTTESRATAARAIWTNAFLTIPATLLFFAMGTCLFLFYRSHPEKMDFTTTTDQIFPLFISRELPVGIAGLIVAAIFAAAQSTVSTSMNSVATTLVTDFIKPIWTGIEDRRLLRIAQVLTVVLGCIGTGLGLFFVDPDIRSLFDQFIKVIGLFMGVLGGLFILGVFFPRTGRVGAALGATSACAILLTVWQMNLVQGYLFTAIGVCACVVVGAAVSLLEPQPENIDGLHIWSLSNAKAS